MALIFAFILPMCLGIIGTLEARVSDPGLTPCGDTVCRTNEICQDVKLPASCANDSNVYSRPNGNCLPQKECKECCPENCDRMDCRDGGRCVYKHVNCIRAPCCPVAECITREETPTSTCDNVKCAPRCRMIQEQSCFDSQTCAYPTCSIFAYADYPFCPSG